jgi:hypothetical protein
MEREIPEQKSCANCGEMKPSAAFRPNVRMKSGLESYCRECSSAKSAEWRARNADRVRELDAKRVRTPEERWTARLRREYKISPAEYWALSEKQSGVCAICLEPEPGRRGLLHVAHDHETGNVRGLLCHRCNVALGHFRDRTDLLRSAIAYLGK